MTKVAAPPATVRALNAEVPAASSKAPTTVRGYSKADTIERVGGSRDVKAAEARVIERLNAFALARLAEGPTCAPSFLGLLGPLMYASSDAQLERIMKALGLSGVAPDALLSAITSLSKATPTFTSMWAKPGVEVHPEFALQIEEKLGTLVLSASEGELKQKVDSWSFGATHGRIIDLIKAYGKHGFVAASAYSSDPMWLTAFDRKRTERAEFTKRDGSKAQVQLMSGEVECKSVTTDSYCAAKVPLETNLSFVMVVPNEGVPIEKVAKELETTQASAGLLKRMTKSTGTVRIPRMNLGTRRASPDVMTPELRGPYDKIGPKPVSFDTAVEAWVLRINETGLTIGAGIGAQVAPPTEIVSGDRAFIYMVRDESTGMLLATGIYDG